MKKIQIKLANARENPEAWLALRRHHITATDWPKITGSSRWGTTDDVIFDKQTSDIEWEWEGESEFSLPMQVGTDLEPLIIKTAKKMQGPGTYLSQAFVTRKHMGFTPDLALVRDRSDWVLTEIKVSVRDWRGTVPLDCMDQVRFQATVLGIDQVQVIHLKLASWKEGLELIRSESVPPKRLAVYRVDVSEAERKRIEQQAERWWKIHIVNGGES